MLRASPSPLRPLLLGLVALGACQTPHSFRKESAAGSDQAPAPAPARTPRALPQGTAEGAQESLLNEYADRKPQDIASPDKVRRFSLPNDAKGIVATLLTFAAKDDLSRLPSVLTHDARWGIPDRREYDGRPILDGDGGAKFFDVLRDTAARFSRKENLNCPPIMPGATTYVRNGAEPMWCFYISNDSLDILAFKFVYEFGGAKIDYVGLHPERPTAGVRPRAGAQPPPMTPNIRRTLAQASRVPNPNLEVGPGNDAPVAPGTPGAGQPSQPPAQPGAPGQPGQPPGQPGVPGAGQNPAATAPPPGTPAPANTPAPAGTPGARKPATQPTTEPAAKKPRPTPARPADAAKSADAAPAAGAAKPAEAAPAG